MKLILLAVCFSIVSAESILSSLFGPDSSCEQILSVLVDQGVSESASVALHHNGDPDPCSLFQIDIKRLNDAIDSLETKDCKLSKYEVETVLTKWMSLQVQGEECSPVDKDGNSFLNFCDQGPDFTPIQHDHKRLVKVPGSDSLPCRFYTREGVRITSLLDLKDIHSRAKTEIDNCMNEETCPAQLALHLYAVPAGRVFMFGPKEVGELFMLDHVKDSVGKSLIIETLSLSPRVFDIHNFFSPKEAEGLVERALAETSETHKLHRSTTGTVGKSVINKRTSENAWDTSSPLAQRIKRRCFAALGIDEYQEGLSDGLQILRYNLTTAYNSHMDYFDNPKSVPYDYDSAGKGGNRFATILLYFTDLPENGGGETAFTKAKISDISPREALEEFRKTPESSALKQGSWEEDMTVHCRTHVHVKPRQARAVLFYSQLPDGKEDHMSLHGGCPVLNGTKWAANLWVWNAPRPEFPGAPMKKGQESKASEFAEITVTFKNSGRDARLNKAKLYYEKEHFFGNLGPKDPPIRMNTFKGHKWHIMVGKKVMKTIVITDPDKLEYVI